MFLTDVNNTRELQDALLLVVPIDSPRVAFSDQAPYTLSHDCVSVNIYLCMFCIQYFHETYSSITCILSLKHICIFSQRRGIQAVFQLRFVFVLMFFLSPVELTPLTQRTLQRAVEHRMDFFSMHFGTSPHISNRLLSTSGKLTKRGSNVN